MNKAAFVFLFLFLAPLNPGFSQIPSAGQIEKTQQDLEMEKSLREEVEKGKKVLIRKIIIKGATLLTADQLKNIALSFNGHWLTESDINLVLDTVTSAYKENGYQDQPAKISYQLKKGYLEVSIEEALDQKQEGR